MTLAFKGAAGERRAEIRKAADGYSVFTWSDFGGNIGVIQWRERHAQEYGPAFYAACAWLRKSQLAETVQCNAINRSN